MAFDSAQLRTFFHWLMRAAAANGRDALAVVAQELDHRWAQEPPQWPWSFDNQREFALLLFDEDKDRQALVRRIERVEIGDDLFDEPSSRIVYQRDQAVAWLKAGEQTKADRAFRRMVDTACGLKVAKMTNQHIGSNGLFGRLASPLLPP